MLKSSWGKLLKRPQHNAGCCQLATASYPVETIIRDMPPVESSMATLTSLGLARVSSNLRCPHKECAKMDHLATRSFEAAAWAHLGSALDNQDTRALVDAALSSHPLLT